MEHQRRTERKDRAEQLRKMEVELKNERSSKDPVMTRDELIPLALQGIGCDLAYVKLRLLEKEASLRENKAQIGKVEAMKRQAEIACSWQEYARLKEKLRINRMRFEEMQKAAKFRHSQSTFHGHAKSAALLVDFSSDLNDLIDCVAREKKKVLGETSQEEVGTQYDTLRKGAEAENNTLFKEEETEHDAHGGVGEAEDGTPLQEEETEHDAHGEAAEAEDGTPLREEETEHDAHGGAGEAEAGTPLQEEETEHDAHGEAAEAEADTPLEEEETEDDIRLEGLFAQMENLFAQYESLGLGAQFEAQQKAFLKRLDDEKAKSLREAAIRDGLDRALGTR